MICQICSKHPATIHVTEIQDVNSQPPVQQDSKAAPSSSGPSGPPPTSVHSVEQKHLCEQCAQGMNLPHAPVASTKNALNIWKLLQNSARRARQEGSLACPDCGMTLADFRTKGRLGCPKDYEIFRAHLRPLLQRVHNAESHTGRLPGVDEAERERRNELNGLRAQLEKAVGSEDYENAAQLRDAIQQLETQEESSS